MWWIIHWCDNTFFTIVNSAFTQTVSKYKHIVICMACQLLIYMYPCFRAKYTNKLRF